MEYRLVAFMVNEVPMEQLAEIEGNSPVSFVGKVRRDVAADRQHLRKETDWLWEYHLLKDHPMFYDQCRERHGELRTTGWRRMYQVRSSGFALQPPVLTRIESPRRPGEAQDQRCGQAAAEVQGARGSEAGQKGRVCGQNDCSYERQSSTRTSRRYGRCQSWATSM